MDEKIAIALNYKPGEHAPEILAIGKGEEAEKLLQIAQAHGIPLEGKEGNPTHGVTSIQLKTEIPHEFYGLVGEVIGFVHKLEESWQKTSHKNGGTL